MQYGNMTIWQYGNMQHGNMEYGNMQYGNMQYAIWQYGNMEIWQHDNMAIWKYDNMAIWQYAIWRYGTGKCATWQYYAARLCNPRAVALVW